MGYKIFSLVLGYILLYAEAKLTEDELKNFLETTFEDEMSDICYRVISAEYDFITDIANQTKGEIATNASIDAAGLIKERWEQYFKDLHEDDYIDPAIKRQVKVLRVLGLAALDEDKLVERTNIINNMMGIFSTAKICPYANKDCNISLEGLSLQPEIEDIMATSTDYDELTYIWKSWRDATGDNMKDLYKKYVNLSNEVAKANNFEDYGAYWRNEYEDENFVQNMDELWSQVAPLYNELHFYVANKLKQRYKNSLIIPDCILPAHIFGDMWAQDWSNIFELVKPFPNASAIDIDSGLKELRYTVYDMFTTADDFYQTLGLSPMTESYDEDAGAMINKPTDGREVLCHAGAFDFCDGKTFRLKMCTKVNFQDFITIHHEMGHIQYYMQYKDQPYVFRKGANPAFHEAIGDTVSLSVSTPYHLQKIGLVSNYTDNYEAIINSLMKMALSKIAFLPFGYIVDKWRWDVFAGKVPENQWNAHWWKYRLQYQMLKPPVDRSDETNFDPGAKFHIPADTQYIGYFLAHIMQFQFFKSLCIAAGEYEPINKTVPLYYCDFFQSPAAGDILRDVMKVGASRHWSEVLETMTGSKKVSAEPLLEYFKPLYYYLANENQISITKLWWMKKWSEEERDEL